MMLRYNELPDTMYFGSSKLIHELKNKVFLTPHIGIASMFIINSGELFPKGYQTSCNLSYRQWAYSNHLLSEPLKVVNVIHNIPTFENEIFKGRSSGYIYTVDISGAKGKLALFVTNDPDREVIYQGEEPFTVTGCIPHTLHWDLRFDSGEVGKHGVGEAQKIISEQD